MSPAASETAVAGGFCLGLTPRASKLLVSLAPESFNGSRGDICSGHDVDVEEEDRKLVEGLSGSLSLTAGECPTSVGVKVYCVSSSSIEVASQTSMLDRSDFLIPDKSGLLELVEGLALFITGFVLSCKGLVPFKVPPKASFL